MPSTTDPTGAGRPSFDPPERFNMADYFLDERVREGRGDRTAIVTDEGSLTYLQVQALANRYGHLLQKAGIEPEQRVLIGLPDGPDYVGALFGTLKIGGAVVMVNPHLRAEAVEYLMEYTRAKVALVHADTADSFRKAAMGDAGRHLGELLVLGTGAVEDRVSGMPAELENFPSHRDDAAIWLFSGGTTGRPKAVIQSHTSFANTTECYAKGVLGYREDDVTLSVPKLFFGYATGSNLLFPFAVGGASVLFPDRCTPEVLFGKIERFRPTLLVNVPTMVRRMVDDPSAPERDLSSLRLATSAGEALAEELYERWRRAFDVELLDGLGTAEMWHVFLSNRPGRVRPGTLGEVVPGFEVRVCDDDGGPVPDGEVGWLRVRGGSRAIGYWQRMRQTMEAFEGEWYVSGDMVSRSPDGFFTYHGRGDDMLKVSGKWLAPGEVENRLLQHPAVREAAVVGVTGADGLVRPYAFVVAEAGTPESGVEAGTPESGVEAGTPESGVEAGTPESGVDAGGARPPLTVPPPGLADVLRKFVREGLESYKVPREVYFLEELPRTHLGKVDRGKLRALALPDGGRSDR